MGVELLSATAASKDPDMSAPSLTVLANVIEAGQAAAWA